MPNIESIILGSQRSPKGNRGPPEPCMDAVGSKLYSCVAKLYSCGDTWTPGKATVT